MIYHVPFPGYWLYECSIRGCSAAAGGDVRITRSTREQIQTARSEHDQQHACGELEAPAVRIEWEPSAEVSGLQGAIGLDVPVHRVTTGNVTQDGLF